MHRRKCGIFPIPLKSTTELIICLSHDSYVSVRAFTPEGRIIYEWARNYYNAGIFNISLSPLTDFENTPFIILQIETGSVVKIFKLPKPN